MHAKIPENGCQNRSIRCGPPACQSPTASSQSLLQQTPLLIVPFMTAVVDRRSSFDYRESSRAKCRLPIRFDRSSFPQQVEAQPESSP